MEPHLLLTVSPPKSGGGGKGVQHLAKNNLDKARNETKGGGVVVKEEAQCISLGLGICADEYGGQSLVTIKQDKGVQPSITADQLNEFYQQVLIFKFIVSGIPVPFPLVFSIWKSVSTSFGCFSGGMFPKFTGFSRGGIDHRSLMDPESGRCRRTDGKKWRCSKDVLPDQKYCERHMHRGRHRSRKPVEAAENILQLDTTKTTSDKTNKSHIPTDNKNTKLPVPILPAFKTSNGFPFNGATGIASSNVKTGYHDIAIVNYNQSSKPPITYKRNKNNANVNGGKGSATIAMSSTSLGADTVNSICKDNSDCFVGKDAGVGCLSDKKNIENSNNGNMQLSLVTPGSEVSLKKVLHGDSSSRTPGSGVADVEPQRCRRTDGKKWRCSREVIPREKYCQSHMHRGSKKRVLSSKIIPLAATPLAIMPKTNHLDLNTDLESPQTHGDTDNSTGGNSNSTTITDDSTGSSHNSAISV